MRTIKLLALTLFLTLSSSLMAQVSMQINIGTPPQWGPVGYTEMRYYYLPGVDAYYDVQSSMFIYYYGGVWIHRNRLPSQYRNYDLYSGYKIVLSDYRGNTPYAHFKEHRSKYNKGYRGIPQRTIGEKPGNGNQKSKHGKQKGGKHKN